MADDLLPGATIAELRWSEAEEATYLAAFGDTVVVQVGTDEEALLVGLAAEDGSVRWSQSGPSFERECWSAFEDSLLLCDVGQSGSYTVLDPASGEPVHEGNAPGAPIEIISTRDAAYIVHALPDDGEEFSHDIGVVALDRASFGTQWTQNLPAEVDVSDEPNSHDGGVALGLTGERLTVSYGPQSWALDTRSGDVVQTETEWSADIDGSGYLLSTEFSSDIDSDVTLVRDSDGNTLLQVPGYAWRGQGGSSVVDGRIGAEASLHDLASGEVVWSRDDLAVEGEYGSGVLRWAPDPDIVLAEDPWDPDASVNPGVTLLDAGSGDTLWYSETGLYDTNSVFTSDAIAIGDEFGNLGVHARSDGELVWERSLGDVTAVDAEDAYWYGMATTDSSLVVVGSNGVAGFTGFSTSEGEDPEGSDEEEDGETEYATDCGSEPIFTPVESEAAYGGVTVTFTVSAVCPSGQWLSSSGQQVTLSVDSAGGTEVYAAGVFDFSEGAAWVPGEGEEPTTMALTFPLEGAYATPDEINAAIADEVIHVVCIEDPAAFTGEVPSDPSEGVDTTTPVQATSSALDEAAAEDSALAALRRIAAADDPDVAAELEGLWMPQLSSKQPGTFDDGIVYTYQDILAEHLRLRLRYVDVRLVFSSDWKSFLVSDYWVTLVGDTSARPGPALAWCDDNYFTPGHCYAKRLLRDGPSEGSTKHRT